MAKKVTFIPGVDAMSGILAGRAGKLVYAENDNKAFDAPVGNNYARNYGARIVLAQRAKDGKTYFSVKTKSATMITAQTKMRMALLGAVSSLMSALQKLKPADWAILVANFEYFKLQNPDREEYKSMNIWLGGKLRRMLQYKIDSVVVSGPKGNVTIYNPWKLESSSAILVSTFEKFLMQLGYTENRKSNAIGLVTIDSASIPVPFEGTTGTTLVAWGGFVGNGGTYVNANYQQLLLGRGLENDTEELTFNGLPIYNASGDLQNLASVPVLGDAYTTIAPQA